MNQPTTRVLVGVLWLSTVAAAYFLGQSGATVPGAVAPANPASAGTAAVNSEEARSGRVVEAFTGNTPDDLLPGGRKNVASMVARARAEMASGMNGMMNFRGMLRAIAPMAELDDAQIQEALAEVEKTTREPQQKMMFYSLLLGQWAENDGPAALAYAEKNMKGKGMFDFGIKSAVLGSWARRDPDAVWRWYQTERQKGESDQSTQMTVSALFAGMASKDIDAAFARLNTLEEHERPMAAAGIASTGGDERARQRLLERSESLAPELRRQIQENAIRSWAMMDPEEALKWIRTRPAEDQSGLRSTAANMVMMSDPQRGADLLMEGATEKDKPRIYDTIVGSWANRDPRAAAEWLTKQPQGPELDNARRTFASLVTQRDPSAAMDWAKSVTNEDQRNSSVQQIYQTWRKRDEKAAEAALEASGIAPEKIASFRQAAKGTLPGAPQ
jgi:hypothetical protein